MKSGGIGMEMVAASLCVGGGVTYGVLSRFAFYFFAGCYARSVEVAL
jgi:hypothetical protein